MDSKKQKLNQIKVILGPAFEDQIPLIKVYISKLNEKKNISKAMAELSKNCPLENLQHLKRVRNNEIMICEADIDDLTIFLNKRGISKDLIEILTTEVTVKEVPSKPTILRWQFDEMNKLWPCKFHPNKYFESLFDGSIFSEDQISFHLKMADLLNFLEICTSKDFGICVDSRDQKIVAIAENCVEQNPILHCPMVLIDHVAKTQGSGAWEYPYQFHNEFKGISEDIFLKLTKKYENLKFGAEDPRGKGEAPEDGEDNLAKYGPYLCTGYDIYLNKEPCLMCSMALVHSRSKRIFFCKENTANGALMTKIKLHTVKDLNHHFEVFWIK